MSLAVFAQGRFELLLAAVGIGYLIFVECSFIIGLDFFSLTFLVCGKVFSSDPFVHDPTGLATPTTPIS